MTTCLIQNTNCKVIKNESLHVWHHVYTNFGDWNVFPLSKQLILCITFILMTFSATRWKCSKPQTPKNQSLSVIKYATSNFICNQLFIVLSRTIMYVCVKPATITSPCNKLKNIVWVQFSKVVWAVEQIQNVGIGGALFVDYQSKPCFYRCSCNYKIDVDDKKKTERRM